jgi:hypothetical protein
MENGTHGGIEREENGDGLIFLSKKGHLLEGINAVFLST